QKNSMPSAKAQAATTRALLPRGNSATAVSANACQNWKRTAVCHTSRLCAAITPRKPCAPKAPRSTALKPATAIDTGKANCRIVGSFSMRNRVLAYPFHHDIPSPHAAFFAPLALRRVAAARRRDACPRGVLQPPRPRLEPQYQRGRPFPGSPVFVDRRQRQDCHRERLPRQGRHPVLRLYPLPGRVPTDHDTPAHGDAEARPP